MRLEQCHDTSAHLPPNVPRLYGWRGRWSAAWLSPSLRRLPRLCGCWCLLGALWRERGTAGHVEEALVLLLHLRQHLYQLCLTLMSFSQHEACRIEFPLQDINETLLHGERYR